MCPLRISVDWPPGMGTVRSQDGPMLSLSGYCQFSAVEPVHMPTSSTNAFRSLHICTNMTYFYHSITKKKKKKFCPLPPPPSNSVYGTMDAQNMFVGK